MLTPVHKCSVLTHCGDLWVRVHKEMGDKDHLCPGEGTGTLALALDRGSFTKTSANADTLDFVKGSHLQVSTSCGPSPRCAPWT